MHKDAIAAVRPDGQAGTGRGTGRIDARVRTSQDACKHLPTDDIDALAKDMPG